MQRNLAGQPGNGTTFTTAWSDRIVIVADNLDVDQVWKLFPNYMYFYSVVEESCNAWEFNYTRITMKSYLFS